MGSSESTGRSNGVEKQTETNSSDGTPKISNGVEKEEEANSSDGTPKISNGVEKKEDKTNSSGGTPKLVAAAVAIGGAAVAAWSILSMLSDDKLKNEMNTAFKSLGMQPSTFGMPTATSSNSPPRRFKLNTDGACHPYPKASGIYDNVLRGPSGYAGILEYGNGNWVLGFRGFIGVTDCLTAELYGVCKGVELLDKLGCMESVLESDSQAAVEWVTGEDDDRYGKSRIVRDCWDMIMKSRQLVRKNKITIRLCSRDVNKHADKLAGIAINKGDAYIEFTDVDGEING